MSDTKWLSTKPIPPNERLILALDVPEIADAKAMVEMLGDSVVFYKIGLELFMAGDYFELVSWLKARGKRVFIDLKFFDVPQTVANAVARACKHNADFLTIHGNDGIMKAAGEAKKGSNTKVLAVTVLTSLDAGDIADLGFDCNVADLVASRARRAVENGCDGVISSGLEAPVLRDKLGANFLVVCPGIRPVENKPADDQKRTVDVRQAFENGADYIVVGRPIHQAKDPKAAAEAIQATIAEVFA